MLNFIYFAHSFKRLFVKYCYSKRDKVGEVIENSVMFPYCYCRTGSSIPVVEFRLKQCLSFCFFLLQKSLVNLWWTVIKLESEPLYRVNTLQSFPAPEIQRGFPAPLFLAAANVVSTDLSERIFPGKTLKLLSDIPQQTNCCLLPLRALWSPNELVSSQEMRKGTHKINLSGYYALSSAKTKTC